MSTGVVAAEAEVFWEALGRARELGRFVEGTLLSTTSVRLHGNFAHGYGAKQGGMASLKPCPGLDALVGSRVQCRVEEADSARDVVVLSIDLAHEQQRRETLGKLVPGSRHRAYVTAVADYGALLVLEGISTELTMFTVMLHATAFGPSGAPVREEWIQVTPELAWTPTFEAGLFFVRRS